MSVAVNALKLEAAQTDENSKLLKDTAGYVAFDENHAENTYKKTIDQNWGNHENSEEWWKRAYLSDATISGLSEAEQKDLDNDPLCFFGATAETDIYGPPADCCYGYELPKRVGKYWSMCLRYDAENKPQERIYNFGDYWAQHTWAEEFSSFWCGPDVKLECKYKIETANKKLVFSDDVYILLGGQINDQLGHYENRFTWCKVTPDDGNHATLWHETKCGGLKHHIEIPQGKRSSECEYDDMTYLWTDAKYGWKVGQIASVTLAAGNAIEVFQKTDFDDHSYTIRNFSQKEDCFEFSRSFWVNEANVNTIWASYDAENTAPINYGIESL